jgi:hypothetical protein
LAERARTQVREARRVSRNSTALSAVPYPVTNPPDAFRTQAAFTIVNATITRTDLRIEHLFD